MRHLVPIVAVLSTMLAAMPARAQSPMTGAGYWQCQSYMGNTNTEYFSGVFEGTADQPVQPAFDQMLAGKYAFKGGGSCGIAWKSGTTIDKLKADLQSASAQLRAAGKKVIETGWQYSGDTRIRYWCYGIVTVSGQGAVKNYSYATGIFEIPGSSAGTLQSKWHDYLKTQHAGALVSLANCAAAQGDSSKTDAQISGWRAQYASKAENVHSDWKGE